MPVKLKIPFRKRNCRANKHPEVLRYEELEQRVLFSADAVPGVEASADEQAVVQDVGDTRFSATEASPETSETTVEQSRWELVLVNDNVADSETLLTDLQQQEGQRIVEIVTLDSTRSGIEQVSDILAERTDLDTVHIISHGTVGAFALGSEWLDNDDLLSNADTISTWAQAFNADADILVYGCNLAAGAEGQRLINSLSLMTGADIAASDDLTGNQFLGGDWELETSIGSIDSDVIVSTDMQSEWQVLLDTITVTTTADTLDVDADTSSLAALATTPGSDGFISLREAIIAANNDSGADEILLPAGTYNLAILGTGEDLGATGDLDILEDLTITGSGADVTTIDANDIDRVFDVTASAGNVNLSGVTMFNGTTSNSGGGIRVQFGNTVSIVDSEITDNVAADLGGGIYSNGSTVLLTRATLSGNSAIEGGAIRTDSGSVTTLTNTTISANSASSNGGAIYTPSDVTIINSTIANNTSSGVGGIFTLGGGDADLLNTILSNNSGGNANKTLTSSGHNIDSDGTAGLAGTGDQVVAVADLKLGTLQNNGGTTRTHALGAGSVAIDAGNNTGAPATDQRGYVRSDGNPDIGAYEYTTASIGAVDEFLVNDLYENGRQETVGDADHSQRAVAMADDGSYVVVWSSEGQDAAGWGVYAQRFDKFGNELSGEILVNETESGNERWARVASDGAGNFVVTWTTDAGFSEGVKARRFDSTGNALGSEFYANTTAINAQQDSSIAMDGAGNFIIVWEGDGVGDSDGVFYRRYYADGTAMDAAERQANLTDAGNEQNASVAMDADGDFVVVWEQGGYARFQMFASDGTAGASGNVYSSNTGASNPDVAMDDSGNFVVVYRWDGTSAFGVWGHRYDSSGAPQGSDFRIGPGSSLANMDHTNPSIAMDGTGNFIVTYESISDGVPDDNDKTVFAERFQSDATSVGRLQVNQTTAGDQYIASVAMLDIDNYVVVFTGADGDQTGVYARQFGTLNTAPTITTIGNQTIAEDTSTGSLSFTVDDAESAVASLIVTAASSDTTLIPNGNLTLMDQGGGNWTIEAVPAANLSGGPVTITVTVDDGTTTTDETFTVTVTAVNDAPVAVNDSITVTEDTPFNSSIDLDANDTDVDGDALSVVPGTFSTTQGGTLVLAANGSYTYTPATNFNGTDTVDYTVTDGSLTDIGTLTITVTGTNDQPTVSPVNVNATEDGATVNGSFVFSDDDPSDSHTFTIVGSPAEGSVVNNGDGTFTFDPGSDFQDLADGETRDVIFSYYATDDSGAANADSTNATVTISVTGTNDVPLITSTPLTAIDEDTLYSYTLTASDVDTSDTLTFSAPTLPAWLSFNTTTGELSGTPTNTEVGDHSVLLRVNDGTGDVDQSFTITVNNTNDQPTVSAVNVNATEDGAMVNGSFVVNDDDPGDSHTFTIVGSPAEGSVVNNGDGTFTFDPGSDFQDLADGETRDVTFSYYATDDSGAANADSTNATVTVTITGSNDGASITGTSSAALTESDVAQSTGGSLSVSDADSGENVFVAQTDTAGSNGYGLFSIDAAGSWTYTMNTAHDEFVAGVDYSDSFTVASADGTATQIVTVTITGSNDGASITGTSSAALTESDVAQSTGGSLSVSDADSGENVFVAQTDTAGSNGYGLFSIDAAGSWTYTMNNAHDEFVAGVDYSDSFTVASADGTATQIVTVTITGSNDGASITGTSSAALTESDVAQSTGGSLSVSDADSGENVFVAQTDTAGSNGYGLFSIDAAGSWTYTMNNAHDEFVAGVDYSDSFTVASADGTATQIVTVTITGSNDGASITGTSSAALTESDVAQSTGGSLSVSDADSGENVFVAQTDTAGSNGYGLFSIDAAGSWTYTMNNAHDEFVAGVDYSDSFTVASADGTATQIVTVTITGSNEAPTGSVTISGTPTEDQTLTAANTLADADGMGIVSYQWQRDGVDIVGATNSTYILGDGDVGSTISVVASYTDGEGTIESVTSAGVGPVANVNDAPVGVPSITGITTENQVLTADTSAISDADGLGVFLYQWYRDGAAISGATAGIYTLGDADVGSQLSVQVRYTDAHGTAEGPLVSAPTAAIAGVNDAPTITSTAISTATEDSGYSYTITAIDVDSGDTLTLSAPILPAWLSFDPATGLLSGTPTNAEIGDHNVTLRVNDGTVDVDQSFTITVKPVTTGATQPPTTDPSPLEPGLPPVGEQPVVEEQPVEVDVEGDTTDQQPTVILTSTTDSGLSRPVGEDGSNPVRERLASPVRRDSAVNQARPSQQQSVLASLLAPKSLQQSLETGTYTDGQLHSSALGRLRENLDQVKEEVDGQGSYRNAVVGSAVAVSTGLSAGYVAWLIRGGMLVSSVLTSMPAWHLADPLPLLSKTGKEDEEDEETLESIIKQSERRQNQEKEPPGE